MCGILCHVTRKDDANFRPSCWSSLSAVIDARGPDGSCEKVVETERAQITIRGSALALRGPEVVQQPLQSEDGRLLMLWNGEIFDSLVPLDPSANDGGQILDRLTKNLQGRSDEQEIAKAISLELSSIEGPFAFVIYDSKFKILLYGRDTLGRRSLLQHYISEDEILFCSAASIESLQSGHTFSEVDCTSFWMIKANGAEIRPTRVPRCDTVFTLPHRLHELSITAGSGRSDLQADQVSHFLEVLSDSVKKRVSHIRIHGSKQDAQVAILFSGGLDCTTLALLAHQHIDPCQPIDLLNVAFENPRILLAKAKSESKTISPTFNVPDRITGRQSYHELQRLAPNRTWNFIEIDVCHQEYLLQRPIVESLMMPCTSVMDLSIASALYFASRGKGNNVDTSTAKVLLSGLGADELLGGYSRHRKAFSAGGQQALVEELQMDLDRLATRNLGRDDRILSSSGKEARYPFLSHSVISYLANLPVEIKMDFVSLPAGQGDKMLLRQAAARLGLKDASLLVKRAIQFGARSAKMEIGQGKVLGHEMLKS